MDLTDGPILRRLMYLAAPIIGSQTLQMLYNLTDMFWVGRLGSDEVAATGAAGLYMWMSVAFMLFGSIGVSIGVSQAFGANDIKKAKSLTNTALFISLALGMAFALIMIVFRRQMAGFFNFAEQNVVAFTEDYLAIVAISIPLTYISATIGAVYTAHGNSRTPFICNAAGAAINIALDPLLIFTAGLGVHGAAYATAAAQIVVCVMLLLAFMKMKKRPFESIKLLAGPSWDDTKWIIKKAAPVCAESFLFTFLVMATSRREAFFGADAMAISRVGSQIESLTWLVGGAFGSALISFIGQNYGAKKWDRINSTYKVSTVVMLCYGAFVAFLLAVPGKYIFGVFLPDEALIERSVLYLRILAICQIPMCMEGVASNTFRGIGKTIQPAIVSTVCNVLRVPLAYILSAESPGLGLPGLHLPGLGLPGVWIAISVSACAKGIWSYAWYMLEETKRRRSGHLA